MLAGIHTGFFAEGGRFCRVKTILATWKWWHHDLYETLLDINLDKLLQIAIEGPELDSHDFEELFDI